LRLRTDFWVRAYLRRCENAGLYGAVVHKGAAEAGAVYVLVNRLDGNGFLFEPSPGPAYDERGERRFCLGHAGPLPADQLAARGQRLIRADPDIWLVEIEDRAGSGFIEPESN
jgi:hypothetical protein